MKKLLPVPAWTIRSLQAGGDILIIPSDYLQRFCDWQLHVGDVVALQEPWIEKDGKILYKADKKKGISWRMAHTLPPSKCRLKKKVVKIEEANLLNALTLPLLERLGLFQHSLTQSPTHLMRGLTALRTIWNNSHGSWFWVGRGPTKIGFCYPWDAGWQPETTAKAASLTVTHNPLCTILELQNA